MNERYRRGSSLVYGASEHAREVLWLAPTAVLLVTGASFLAFTSLSGDLVGTKPELGTTKSQRTLTSEEPEEQGAGPEPDVLIDDDWPHSEPWWLIALTFLVVIGMGLLLIFYAQLPPFLG